MDSTALILDRIKGLNDEFAKIHDERNRVASANEQEKVGLDERLKSIERNINGFEKIMAQVHRASLPGLEVGTAPGKASWGRVIKACVSPALLRDKEYGVEADIYRHMSTRLNEFDPQTKASINAASGEGGGFLVPTEMMNDLIPQLRESSIARQLGVTTLDNLVGNITWTKSKGGITAQHINTEEEETGTESVATFDKIELTPHPIAAFVPLTFGMQTQPAIALDAWVKSEIATQMALLEDQSIFVGTGAASAPRGIFNHPNVSTSNWASVDTSLEIFQTALDVVKATRKKFGQNLGNLGWATSPDVLYWLAKAKDTTNRAMFFSLTDGNLQTITAPPRMLRYPIMDTDQLDTGTDSAEQMMFGPWADVYLGHWGTLVFAMSDQTETNFRKLRTTVRGVWQYDVGVFHADAFVKCTGIPTNVAPT